jgi:zinc transporter 9
VEHYNSESDSLTFHIAIDLLLGFLLMMIVEHVVSGDHHHSHGSASGAHLEFEAELDELDTALNGHHGRGRRDQDSSKGPNNVASAKERAIPFTFGLILHGIADGCALGVSAIETTSSESESINSLSLIVFLALLFHKGTYESLPSAECWINACSLAPTSVAFSVGLLNTSLPRSECRKYLAIFASSTPLGAIVTYFLLSFFGFANNAQLAGSALLASVSILTLPITLSCHPKYKRPQSFSHTFVISTRYTCIET